MALLVPSASQLWHIFGPIVSVVVLIWLVRNCNQVIERLFPHLEWERRLGWLNAGADRRARLMLRGLHHLVLFFLALDLLVVLWFAWQIGQRDTETPVGMLVLAGDFVYWGAFLSPCLYYLFVVLVPRVHAEFEEQELARYRAENPDVEHEKKSTDASSPITVWESTHPRRF
jgi:hypothetical protein